MQLPYRKPGKYSQINPDPMLTLDKFDELKNKLEKLLKTRPLLAKEVSRLAELGDFSENVEYQLAKGKLRGLNNTILKLEYQLNHAQIIKPQKQIAVVQIGNTVTLSDQGKEKTYQILGSTETNPQKGIISHNSPLGQGLLGKKINDTLTIKLTNKEVAYKIIRID